VIKSISDELVNWSVSEYAVIPDEQVFNILSVLNTSKYCLLANSAQIAMRTRFQSQEIVIYYRDLIADRMNEFIIELGEVASGGGAAIGIGTNTDQFETNNMLQSIKELLEIFLEGMNDKISNISATTEYNPFDEGDNCLTLAYNKYQDLSRMDEIFYLNEDKIRHPGFIPGGTPIRILEE